MYDPKVGRFLTEDPIGFEGDPSNVYRYVHNNPLSFIDPSGLDETIATAEGRVSGKTIEEALEKAGATTQQGIDRTTPCGKVVPGRVDAVQAGKNIEIGPASPTGVPAKAGQAASAGNADVVLYQPKGKVPKAGDTVDYLRLPYDKIKELQEQAKRNKWTPTQIWDAAKKMAGQVSQAKVTQTAAAYAGRLYRGGKLLLTTGTKCFMGVSPLDLFFDGIDYIRDPEGFSEKPALLLPGMLVIPPVKPNVFRPPPMA